MIGFRDHAPLAGVTVACLRNAREGVAFLDDPALGYIGRMQRAVCTRRGGIDDFGKVQVSAARTGVPSGRKNVVLTLGR